MKEGSAEMKLKKKYRILEKRYSDGGVGFFPQRGDWWHGWRYFADNSSRRGWDEPNSWLSYDTYEEAEQWLRREMAASREIAEGKRPKPSFPHVFAIKSIPHPVEEK
jgi:hypothetical protein